MKWVFSLLAALALTAGASLAGAEELKSGLQPGDRVPAFQVVNCGGADDGVKVGQQLCYR